MYEACILAIDKVPMGHLTVMQYNKMRFDHYVCFKRNNVFLCYVH